MTAFRNIFEHWNLDRVINASGTMTSIGASRVKAPVIEAVNQILPEFISIDHLQASASQVISRIIGTEAGCITASSASAITTGVAASITGSDLAAIEKLPDCRDREHRVAVQMGHMINYGAPIPQAITLSGAELVPLGTSALCEVYHLEAALKQGLAAAVYVVSHHTVREGELPLDIFVETCHEHNVPVIADMASEYDMKEPVDLGADLIIYSGHKFMGATTSGIVAGTRDLVQATYLQNRGIGRTMKVGKEGIVGAMAALELWSKRDQNEMLNSQQQILDLWMDRLGNTSGLALTFHQDWTGNPITRIRVEIDPDKAGLYAWELVDRLANRRPKIIVRGDPVENGYFFLDPCNLDFAQADIVADGLLDLLHETSKKGDGCRVTWSETKRKRATAPLNWPEKF